MPIKLSIRDTDFADRFDHLLATKREAAADVNDAVSAIIASVRDRGDAALIAYSREFDRLELTPSRLQFAPAEIAEAAAACDQEILSDLRRAADRIEAFHQRQVPADDRYEDAAGIELGERWTALESVGLYVPGGLAAYPSSVLMNAIPARVAGVERIAMAVPTPDGQIDPLVLAAADMAGVSEIYRIGGAQAIAALAWGTETIAPVAKIVGPGNAYVAAAKRQVFGRVGIDMIAGPSEILVVADAASRPEWIAADLLSQAEHDTAAQSILISDDDAFLDRVAAAVDVHLALLPRREIASESWQTYGALINVENLDQAAPLVDRLAPEHLELAVDDPDALLAKIRNAGAIFLGRHTPEAIGDYVAGPNHVLPTARSARYASGLSVADFVKRSTIVRCRPAGLAEIGPTAMRLAAAEGLDAHALSISIRLKDAADG